MRHLPFGAALCTALLSAAPLHAAIDAVPSRKPGYWEITTVAPVSGMTKIKSALARMTISCVSRAATAASPSRRRSTRASSVDVVCTTKEGKQTISTTFTGDFDTRYHAILKTTFDPPLGAISHMGVNIDGKYLGPDCPKDEAAAAEKLRRRTAGARPAGNGWHMCCTILPRLQRTGDLASCLAQECGDFPGAGLSCSHFRPPARN